MKVNGACRRTEQEGTRTANFVSNYRYRVDPTWIVLCALVFGFALGAFIVHAIDVAVTQGRRSIALSNERVPDGVVDVIGALESVGIVIDASSTVVHASPGATTMGVVQGRELVNPELIELAARVRATGEAHSQDFALRRGRFEDSAPLHLHARAAPLGNRFVLLLADDHTEEIRLQEVRRDFVANVSHELKTPIGAISLLADAIEVAAEDTERVRSFAARMQVEAQRLGTMTKEIIDLSRLQADNPLDDPSRVDVGNVVASAIERNRVVAESRRIRLTSRVLDRATVLGDAEVLAMAVQNLVANAIQYSHDATHVGIGVRVVDDIVEISVTDKGVGIPIEDQARVFERFYRVDPARSRVTGGSGLGLSIAKHVAISHGGELRLWSKLGHGSTFTLRIPVADADVIKERT